MSGDKRNKKNEGGGFKFAPRPSTPGFEDPRVVPEHLKPKKEHGTGDYEEGGQENRALSDTQEFIRRQLSMDSEAEVPKERPSVSRIEESESEHREERLPCNFPGLMKILVPEKSFAPVALPVRVTNLSATGAMIEVHDRSRIDKDAALANRFFELKVAHPEIPTLRGTIAWSDMNRQLPMLGLSCFDVIPGLSKLVLADESTKHFQGPPPLPPPEIEAYPPRTREANVVIRGQAPEAMEVVAKGDYRKFRSEVKDGQFELNLELEPNAENHFALRSHAGARKSRAVPIRIINEAAAMPERGRYFHAEISTATDGSSMLQLEFSGNVQQAERVLYRYSQLLAISDRVHLTTTLRTPGTFDQRLYDALLSEGAILASDTTSSRVAAKLLNDLL